MPDALSAFTRRVRALLAPPDAAARSRETRALAAAQAAEGELYHCFGLSLAVQRDVGAHFHDLGEQRLAASRALRAWTRREADGPVEPAEVRLALSRLIRLLQDYPFCFTATASGRPREAASVHAWARDFTLSYPELPHAIGALARHVDHAVAGAGAPRRLLARPLLAMGDRLANAQRAAWEVRRAAQRPRGSIGTRAGAP